ncbi:DBF4-like protein A [Oryzias melastigma]|uniref:Protein DBF4 homolog A n=1 Tax=Oryzias melastigma TaxID=30732 RepID=A0A834L310_ORYME|nr:DBF4-like protein A [Oryzias melastigma]
MKPKGSKKLSGSSWQEKCVNSAEKKSGTLTKQTSSFQVQVSPFAGKVFYLDLPSNRTAETLEREIKELGGTVEKFFSKEIKYLVSNKREAKYVNSFQSDCPVPSLDSGQTSLHPPSKPQNHANHRNKRRSQGQADTLATSRGKSLVERVVKEQGKLQIDRILSNALEWGVKILYIDDVVAYVRKKKKIFSSQVLEDSAVKSHVSAGTATKHAFRKCKGGRISTPFIKVEDRSRHYRPIYLTMPKMPEINLKTAPPYSPFCLEDKDTPETKQRTHRGVKTSVSEEKIHVRKKNRDKKRGGFCECCMMKYNQLSAHLQGDCHKAFSKTDEYSVVDSLASALHCDFLQFPTKVKRRKCSVSSVLAAPGLGEKSHFRRNHHTYLDRPKHKGLTQILTQKAEQTPPFISEVVPSAGEGRLSVPASASQPDVLEEELHKDVNRSNVCSKASTGSVKYLTHEHEDLTKEASVGEERNAFSETVTGKEEGNLSTTSSSPVLKIKRKVRAYKRKKRKVEVSVKHGGNLHDNTMLKLRELFQSSEDMDVEFHGFVDEQEKNQSEPSTV